MDKAIKNKWVSIFSILAHIICGALFLYSANNKFIPIQYFEYTIAEYTPIKSSIAQYLARIIVSLEGIIGLLLFFQYTGYKKWVSKSASALLITFCIFLIYQWAKYGSNVNCGCMGDDVYVTPPMSLLKNMLMLTCLYVGNKIVLIKPGKKYELTSVGISIILLAIPFIAFPVTNNEPQWQKNGFRMSFFGVYNYDISAKKLQLENGKKIVAFVSPKCMHCKIAAYKLHLIKKENPDLPIFLVIAGDKPLKDFYQYTHAENLPYARVDGNSFLIYTGGVYPQIFFLNNGKVEAKAGYEDINTTIIKGWLK